MANEIIFSEASSEDAYGMTLVRRKTWLTTYVNDEVGITHEDIEGAINKRTIEEEEKRIKERIISDKSSRSWVAKDSGAVVGFVSVRNDSERNWIAAFYVLPDYQGMGIGSELMKRALVWLQNGKEIYCEVASYNKQAIDFYKKFGFVENGPTTNEVANLPSGKILPEIEMILSR